MPIRCKANAPPNKAQTRDSEYPAVKQAIRTLTSVRAASPLLPLGEASAKGEEFQ